MAKFKIIIVSKDDNFMMDTSCPLDANYQIYPIANNKENITKVYNKVLDYTKENDKECEFLVFMHSDVKLDLTHLLTHIEECKDKYDVMGLCGCSKFSVSEQPLNWFVGSKNFQNQRWGCVTHGELNNQTSYFNQHSPYITDHAVACIDGLCIIFGRKAIESDLRFDERLRFNCYDTDLSINCVMIKKMKLGVLVEKSLHHYSVGKSILTDDFCIDEKIMREKYNFGIPENSRLYYLVKNNLI